MRSEILSQEKNFVTIRAEVGSEHFREKVEEAYTELGKKAQIKGFRKGHVPRRVLELHLGKDAVHSEALEKLVPDIIDELVKQYELDLIDRPKVEMEPIEADGPVTMTCIFENRPRVELPDLTELEVEKPVVAITGEMIDHAVERVREAHAERVPVSERPAAETDIVEIEYTLSSDNGSESGETPQTAAVDLTQSDARKEVRDALLGANPGDEVLVEMTREPGSDVGEDIVGFNIRVKQIFEKKLPEMGKDLYQKVFGDEVETEEAFREKVSERIQRQMEQEGRTISQRKAIDELVNRAELDLPETLIARAEANISRDIEEKIQKEYGKTVDEYLAEAGIKEEKHKSDIRESATERVRRSLVLEALADDQSVEVVNEDIDREIASMAASMGLEKERIQQYLLGDQDRLGDLIARIRTDKTIEKLMAAVTVREVDAKAEAEE